MRFTDGRVGFADSVVQKGVYSDGGVIFARNVSKSAAAPTAVLSLPVLRESVPAPTPVLKLAPTLLCSENAPTAVFAKPMVVSRFKGAIGLLRY